MRLGKLLEPSFTVSEPVERSVRAPSCTSARTSCLSALIRAATSERVSRDGSTSMRFWFTKK